MPKKRPYMQRRPSNDEDLIIRLSRENEELRRVCTSQAKIIREVQARGQLQIILDQRLPPDSGIVVPIEQVERTRAEQQALDMQIVREWIFEAQFPALNALNELDTLVREVAAVGAVGHGTELRAALQGKDERLAAAFTTHVRTMRRMAEVTHTDFSDKTQVAAENVSRLIVAVQAILTGQDDGAALRAFIRERETSWQAQVLAIREGLSKGGAPAGIRDWRLWIGRHALDLEVQYPNWRGPQVAAALINELEARRQQEPLSPDESIALEKLRRAYGARYTRGDGLRKLLSRAKAAARQERGNSQAK